MWMMNIENKGKRIMASLLALCMIFQLLGWTPGSFQAIAAESGEKPLQKVITVSEKEILRAVKAGEDNKKELNESILPYTGDQKEIAKDHLESILSQSVIVKQKSLGSKCAAIIAVEIEDSEDMEEQFDTEDQFEADGADAEETEEAGSDVYADGAVYTESDSDAVENEAGFDYSKILMIGLNGNEKRDCEFTLEITNADGIVIKELQVTGYRQDRLLPSDSNATATDSNAQPADADAADPENAEEPVLVRTASDAGNFVEADEEDDRSYIFVEDYSEIYDEDVAGLLVSKKQNTGIALLSLLADDGDSNSLNEADEEQEEQEAPKMTVTSGGFGVASLMRSAEGGNEVGKIADINVWVDEEIWDEETETGNVKSGKTFAVYADATYSAVAEGDVNEAFYSIRFEVDETVKDLITGPEESNGAKPVGGLSGDNRNDWEKIKELLGAEDDGDWQQITIESTTFYYSKSEMQAVFGVDSKGGSATGVPFRFRFANGLTPDGVNLTAAPEVLNREELEQDYLEHNPPGSNAEGKVQNGDPVEINCEADFAWSNVTKKQTKGGLGNLNSSAGNPIVYEIAAAPKYGSDKNQGVMYTKGYTVTDEMYFENFYINAEGYEVTYSDRPGEVYLSKGKDKDKDTRKLIGLDLPESAMKNGVAEPIFEEGSQKIIGVRIEYTVTNQTLKTEAPTDLIMKSQDDKNNAKEERARIWFEIENFRNESKRLIGYTGEGTPKITNNVYLDAYSIMYEGDEYPGSEAQENSTTKKEHHHSYAQVSDTATEAYPIAKKAYKDPACTIEATGENQLFQPGNSVYYRITVTNNGYKADNFRVEDRLPEEIEFEKASLIGMEIGGNEKTPLPETEKDEADRKLFWENILLQPGESAVLTLQAPVKNGLKLEGSSSRLDNTAAWFRSNELDNKLGESTATVFVTTDVLQKGEVSFGKSRVGSNGNLTIGDEVSYQLSVKLQNNTIAPGELTLTDHWPEQLDLKKLSNIPAGAVVTLKNEAGEPIASFTNEETGNAVAVVPDNFKTPDGGTMTQNQVAGIRDVDINVFVDAAEKKIQLTGQVKEGGSITNSAGTSAGNESGNITSTSLAMNIEKSAYRIDAGEKSITDDNSLTVPADEKTTFKTGDVVCYEVKVTNNGSTGQAPISPVITDDISNLFRLGMVPELAEATLNSGTAKVEGSVFHRRGEAGIWEKLEAENGKISLDLTGKPLNPGETEIVRIYVTVPEKAVGTTPDNFTNTAQSTLTIVGNPYSVEASAQISTLKDTKQSASIEKEVIAVARNLTQDRNNTYLENAKWKDAELFGEGSGYMKNQNEPFTVGTDDFIFYRVKIHNDSETALRIYEIEDWLPEGTTFRAFYAFNPQQTKNKGKTWGAVGGADQLYLGQNNWTAALNSGLKNNLFYEDAYNEGRTTSIKGSDYAGLVKHAAGNAGMIDNNTYRLRVYSGEPSSSEQDIVTIKPDGTLIFGVIARVTGHNFDTEDILTNTAGFVTDSSVTQESATTGYCEEHDTVGALLNMGGNVGGKGYTSADYKAFTSKADVVYSSYTPGIEKELSYFATTGGWEAYNPDSPSNYFAPTDYMRWTVTLSNGVNSFSTAGPIEEYTISDTLPTGLDYNSDPDAGNEFLFANGGTVKLPEPVHSKSADGKHVVSWKVEKTDAGYTITGEAETQKVTTPRDLSIPANGSITFQVESKPAEDGGALRYGTYVNRADLVPAEKYSYSSSCSGVVEGAGEDRTIYATAEVNIYGSGRTDAWKTINGEYDGEKAAGDGRTSDNYILSDAADEAGKGIVTYGLNVQNTAGGALNNLVIMDRLPEVGDNGLVNNSKRYSDFTVRFADELNLKVTIGNQMLTAGTDYRVFFGKWSDIAGEGSAASDAQWRVGGVDTDSWQTDAPAEDSNTLRIEITDPDVLAKMTKEAVLNVSFQGIVPKAEELKDIERAIAWNTFGYAYELGATSFLTVEPAKVGVKIPTAKLSVTKKVESQIKEDATKQFTFVLEKKEAGSGFLGIRTDRWVPAENQKYLIGDQEFHTGSGEEAGQFLLSHAQEAVFTVIANSEYRVKELDTDGFVVKVTPFTTAADGTPEAYRPENPPTVITVNGESYFSTFINIKSSLVLPDTGGMGTRKLQVVGAFMVMIAFFMLLACWRDTYLKSIRKRKGKNEDEY